MKSTDPILLAEDDRIDQEAIQRAFSDLKIVNPLVIVQNGQEALEYLGSAGNRRPCVILLDLRMPIMSGLEFLEKIKEDKDLKIIPVVVLTTSSSDQASTRSFELGAAGCMVKPVDYQKFVEVVRTLHSYWSLSLTPPSSSLM